MSTNIKINKKYFHKLNLEKIETPCFVIDKEVVRQNLKILSGIKEKSEKLNIKSKFINGLRVTDKKMIKIVEEVMIEFNKKIVKALKKKNCKAKPITIKENNIIHVEKENKKLGYVGKPKK